MKNNAVFVDRDGVINELLYFEEHGRIDTPLNPDQFRLLPDVTAAIKSLQKEGYLLILVSNQPGIAKGQMSASTFQEIREKMNRLLNQGGVHLDGEYYCLHHPHAKLAEYRMVCSCRKPEPGLIIKAAQECNIDLKKSYMVGDGLTDIEAGGRAGCKTVLVSHWSSLLSKIISESGIVPDFVAENFSECAKHIIKHK